MHVVDAHSHLYPRSYIELLKTRTEIPRIGDHDGEEHFIIFPAEAATSGGGRRLDESFWDVQAKLAYMNNVGIDQTVVSLGNPWLDPFDGADSADWARRLNAELASLESATDARIVALGVLPANDVASAVEIAREVAETPTLHGLISGCRVCGLEFDDVRLSSLWAELERAELPLFVHPHEGVALDRLAGYGNSLPLALGFPFETTIAMTKLVFSGVLSRFPKLRIMVAHGGGTLPFLAARLDVTWRSDPNASKQLHVAPSDQLSRLYLDAVLYHPRALHAAAALVGPRKILFGTDHPFFNTNPRAGRNALDAEFEDEARFDVLGGAAVSLFKLAAEDR